MTSGENSIFMSKTYIEQRIMCKKSNKTNYISRLDVLLTSIVEKLGARRPN